MKKSIQQLKPEFVWERDRNRDRDRDRDRENNSFQVTAIIFKAYKK